MAANSHEVKIPEFVREPLHLAQARFCEVEKAAQKAWKGLRQDWSFEELKARITKLQSQGVGRAQELREHGLKRAQELRERADALRSSAVESLELLQGKAVALLGVATRDEVEELSKDLARLARRVERVEKVRKAKATQRSPVEV